MLHYVCKSGKNWDSIKSKVTGYWLDDGVHFSVWEQFSCLPLCPDQLWGPSTILPKVTSLEIRSMECEADHSHPSSTDSPLCLEVVLSLLSQPIPMTKFYVNYYPAHLLNCSRTGYFLHTWNSQIKGNFITMFDNIITQWLNISFSIHNHTAFSICVDKETFPDTTQ
jgi:hypothetical protein